LIAAGRTRPEKRLEEVKWSRGTHDYLRLDGQLSDFDAAFVKIKAEVSDNASVLRPRLLTVEQAAVYMGRSEEAMQHMVANGKVPTVRMDRRVFVDVRDLEALIEDSKNGAAGR